MFVSPVVKSIVGGIGVTAAAITTYWFTAKGDDHTAETRAIANKAEEECGDSNTSVWTISYTSSSGITEPVVNNKDQKNNKNKTYDEWVSCREKHYPSTQTASTAKAK